jgi:hypothetical protein
MFNGVDPLTFFTTERFLLNLGRHRHEHIGSRQSLFKMFGSRNAAEYVSGNYLRDYGGKQPVAEGSHH